MDYRSNNAGYMAGIYLRVVMKHLYLMIEAGKLFDTESQLYKFRIGESAKDRVALEVIKNYAEKHSYYLAPWSLEVRDFCFKLAKSVNRSFLQLNWVYIDGYQLSKIIKQGNALPRKNYISPHEAAVKRMMGVLWQT